MPGSRPHHYQFAHVLLPDLAKSLGTQLLDSSPPLGVSATLTAVWDGLGGSLAEEDRLPSEGLSGKVLDAGGHRMLLVTLPQPTKAPEAYFAVLVRPQGSAAVRCFTLERGADPDGGAKTVVGEWVDGGHRNYGPGPGPEADGAAFVAALERLLTR